MGLKQRVKYYPRMVDDVTLNCCSRAKKSSIFFVLLQAHCTRCTVQAFCLFGQICVLYSGSKTKRNEI